MAEQRHENADYLSQRIKNEKWKKTTSTTTDITQGHLTIFRCSVTGWWQKGIRDKKKKGKSAKQNVRKQGKILMSLPNCVDMGTAVLTLSQLQHTNPRTGANRQTKQSCFRIKQIGCSLVISLEISNALTVPTREGFNYITPDQSIYSLSSIYIFK